MKIPRGAVPRDSIQEKVRPKRPLRAARDVRSIVSGVGLVPGTVTHPPAASSYPSTTAPSGRMEGPLTVTSSRPMLPGGSTVTLPLETAVMKTDTTLKGGLMKKASSGRGASK